MASAFTTAEGAEQAAGEERRIQEAEYGFPYHYLPTFEKGKFSQFRNLRWGYEYLSYTRFVLSKLAERDFDSLLDVGCGDGRLLYEARRLFPRKTLVGVDYFEPAVALARLLSPGVTYVRGDITDPALLGRRFDAATLVDVLEHVPPAFLPEFVAGVRQHVEPGGRLVVTVPSTNQPLNRKHYQHFTLESLARTLEPHFRVTEHHFINRRSRRVRLIESLLTNRLFILNERRLLRALYEDYERHALRAGERDCKRICVVCAPAG
ncbi:MAG TPA: class I SAM-dependent methyltransferase [Pyrinomonadaceae bacterium]|nr:class I SAM-dependent methyltransferase [Pyrinomonadaceae bacterium]